MPFRGTHTQDTRDRIAAKLRGIPRPERTRSKISAAKLGKRLSDEHRAAISRGKQAARLKWVSRETADPA